MIWDDFDKDRQRKIEMAPLTKSIKEVDKFGQLWYIDK